MIKESIKKFSGSKCSGTGELWLDPEGNSAITYDCELSIEKNVLSYSWFYEKELQKGQFTLNKDSVLWTDSWHQKDTVKCSYVSDSWGIFSIFHEYKIPQSPNWGWKTSFCERPDGSLVLQMTNVTSWGEEGRAVRMVFTCK